jgi:hypothetical protein
MFLSTAEFECIDPGNNYTQLLLMKHMLKEHNVEQDVMISYCNNVSDSNISKNPIQQSITTHIGHHLIRELVEDKGVNHDLEDIYIKVLDLNSLRSQGAIYVFGCMRIYRNYSCGSVQTDIVSPL